MNYNNIIYIQFIYYSTFVVQIKVVFVILN